MNSSTFAKMCGVKKRTLFHYDDIGLLKSAFVQENGYREYTLEQLGTMDMIKIFQSCGYSLSEIGKICETDPAEKLQYTEDALKRIDKKMHQLQQMKDYLQSKHQLLDEFHALPIGKCRIQNLSVRYDRKPVETESHFFSFLRDGTDSILLDKTDNIWLCSHSETGAYSVTGRAIAFFLEIPSSSPDLNTRIRQSLADFQFSGRYPYYVEILPHFLLKNPNTAVIKVIVMEGEKG